MADIVAVLVARWLGVALWAAVNQTIGMSNYFELWPSLGLFLLVFAAFGLYSTLGYSGVEEFRRSVLASTLVWLVLTTAVFMTKSSEVYSRGAVLASAVLVLGFAPINRSLMRHILGRREWWGVPVLVLGAGEPARLILESLSRDAGVGLKPVICVDDDHFGGRECGGVPVTGPISLAPQLAGELGIRHAIVAMPGLERQKLLTLLHNSGGAFAKVIVVPNLFGMASLWVSTRDLGGILGLEIRQNLMVPVNRVIKRLMDVCVAVLIGIPALPIVIAAAIWIKIVSPGPAFYRQDREGERGKTIAVYKLRTMYPNAGNLLDRYLASNNDARQEWNRHFKLKRDPRILPRVGTALRRTSLDELPQLWNVLKGEMSLVGPRPFPHYHLDQFTPEFRSFRRSVAPGLTGMWQICDRSDGDLNAQESFDTYYIRNWSIWLDIHILMRTVRAVVFPRGAY